MSNLLDTVVASLTSGSSVPLTKEQLQQLPHLVEEKKRREDEERKQRQITDYVRYVRTQIIKEAMRGKKDLTLQSEGDLSMLGKYKDKVSELLRSEFPDIFLSEDYRHPRDRTQLTGLYVNWG